MALPMYPFTPVNKMVLPFHDRSGGAMVEDISVQVACLIPHSSWVKPERCVYFAFSSRGIFLPRFSTCRMRTYLREILAALPYPIPKQNISP